ncbi:tRNA (adenosine(37)-N6)-threonylcarbamoyltransferase complex dimerization subunit type 1 TsaB [soil metagenome]
MKVLVIETATSVCSVALLENGAVIASASENVGRGHAERLLPMIAALPDGGRSVSILVDCGPGSFTGIRVGVAAARGLGLGWGVPVNGYSSLALLAAGYGAEHPGQPVTVAIHGGHGQLFVQSFARNPVYHTNDLASLTPEAAAAMACPTVIGNAAADVVTLRGAGQASDRALNAGDAVSLPQNLAGLPPTPIYGRDADAKPMADREVRA